jgi:V/A-type H+-transporting ATPase subunit A
MIKIGILQQNSFDKVDTYSSPEKQFKLLKLFVEFYKGGQGAIKQGASLADIRAMSVISNLLKARMDIPDNEVEKLDQLALKMTEQFKNITGVKVPS